MGTLSNDTDDSHSHSTWCIELCRNSANKHNVWCPHAWPPRM